MNESPHSKLRGILDDLVNIRSHRELYKFVAELRDELNQPELIRLFTAAASLHQNFYENWLPSEVVIDCGEAVKQLVDKLRL